MGNTLITTLKTQLTTLQSPSSHFETFDGFCNNNLVTPEQPA